MCPVSPLVELVDTAAVIGTPVTDGGERWGPDRATCGPAWLRLERTNTGKTAATEAVTVVAQVRYTILRFLLFLQSKKIPIVYLNWNVFCQIIPIILR